MAEEFSGSVNYSPPQIHKPLPNNQGLPRDIYGNRAIVTSWWYNFLMVFFFFTLMSSVVIGAIFVYQVSEGKLKSDVTQSVNPTYDAEINNNIQNNYTIGNEYENSYNNTFVFNFQFDNMNLTVK